MATIKETDPALFADLVNRMKRIEGQARGIQRLLDEGAACDAIVNQISAMRAALSQVAVKAAACQLGQLMSEELQAGGSGQKATDAMMSVFAKVGP